MEPSRTWSFWSANYLQNKVADQGWDLPDPFQQHCLQLSNWNISLSWITTAQPITFAQFTKFREIDPNSNTIKSHWYLSLFLSLCLFFCLSVSSLSVCLPLSLWISHPSIPNKSSVHAFKTYENTRILETRYLWDQIFKSKWNNTFTEFCLLGGLRELYPGSKLRSVLGYDRVRNISFLNLEC